MFVNDAAHFRHDLIVETFAKGGHKQKTRFRQQIAVALFTPFWIQEQRAQFAAAGMVVTEKQRRQGVVDVKLFRCVHLGTDAIVVPGVVKPDGHLNGANSRYRAAGAVLKNEHITLLAFRQLAAPGHLRTFNARGQRGFIGRQRRQAAAGLARQGH